MARRGKRIGLAVLVAAAATVALPQTAMGVTVTLDGDTITIVDTLGERNRLSVNATDGGDVLYVYDFGPSSDPQTSDPECTDTGNSVDCPLGGVTRVILKLKAGNDDLDFGGTASGRPYLSELVRGIASGGTGNDELTGNGHLGVTLRGGPGNDELEAQSAQVRGGPDRLIGGGGNDYLEGRYGRDVLIAGRGRDLIQASMRRRDRDAAINCGAGRDHVELDSEDPRARRCELVGNL